MKYIKLKDVISILKEYADFDGSLEKKKTIKPNHGCCCTCQDCGWDYDDCVCDHNYLVDWLNEHVEEI